MEAGLTTPARVQVGPDASEPASRWWVFLVHGALAIAAGVLLLAVPDGTLLLAGIAAGVYLVVAGVTGIGRGLTTPGMLAMERAIPVVVGLVAIAAGIVVLIRPASSVLAIAIAAGIYLVVAGLAAGVAALTERENRVLDALRSVGSIGAGVLLIAWPDISVRTFALILGIYLVVRGLIEIGASLGLARRG